jgi:hypothetical protein
MAALERPRTELWPSRGSLDQICEVRQQRGEIARAIAVVVLALL